MPPKSRRLKKNPGEVPGSLAGERLPFNPEQEGTPETKSLDRKLRTLEWLELRRKGYSYDEIGRQYQVPTTSVHRTVTKALALAARKSGESAEIVRRIELERLDKMYQSLWEQIESGSTRAIEMGLRIMERRAKLTGLDAPEQKQIQVMVEMSDSEMIHEARKLGISVPRILEGEDITILPLALPPGPDNIPLPGQSFFHIHEQTSCVPSPLPEISLDPS